jgi:hypothetical protein
VKNAWYQYFWTELGRRITGRETAIPDHLPSIMAEILRGGVPDHGKCLLRLGSGLSSRRSRNMYGYTWDILRGWGFSRPLRLEPWPGVTMMIPFYRNGIGVMPQSFSSRVPSEKRALSLVGRSAAAARIQCSLWIVPATWNEEILEIFRLGGVRACSLDNLADLCCTGFS